MQQQLSSIGFQMALTVLTGMCYIDLVPAGKAKYDPKKHALVWKLKRFVGQSEHAMAATVELIATTREKKPWARPPIGMQFQVGLGLKHISWACSFQSMVQPVKHMAKLPTCSILLFAVIKVCFRNSISSLHACGPINRACCRVDGQPLLLSYEAILFNCLLDTLLQKLQGTSR